MQDVWFCGSGEDPGCRSVERWFCGRISGSRWHRRAKLYMPGLQRRSKRMGCQRRAVHSWEGVSGKVSNECWFLGHKVSWGGALEQKLCRSSRDPYGNGCMSRNTRELRFQGSMGWERGRLGSRPVRAPRPHRGGGRAHRPLAGDPYVGNVWAHLDKALGWAAAARGGVLLDLHAHPGGQSGEAHTARARGGMGGTSTLGTSMGRLTRSPAQPAASGPRRGGFAVAAAGGNPFPPRSACPWPMSPTSASPPTCCSPFTATPSRHIITSSSLL